MPRIRPELLSVVKLLRGIDESTLVALAAKAKRRTLSMGEKVLDQGDPDIPLFLVLRGCVRLERPITSHETARLALVGDGETVDELAFAGGIPTDVNAIAIEESEVLELSAEDFHSVLRKNGRSCSVIMQNLARRYRESSERVQNLLALDASARLSREILAHVPRDTRNTLDVTLPYSQEELAHRIGTRRETVNRCLKEMRLEGVISDIGRNKYRVDVPGLYRMAGYTVVRTGSS